MGRIRYSENVCGKPTAATTRNSHVNAITTAVYANKMRVVV